MNIVNTIRQFFARPYPSPESFAADIKGTGIAAMVVTAILYAFRPFGMSFYEGNVFAISLMFGAVSLVAGTIYVILIRKLVKSMSYDAQYSFGKWVIEITGMILFIAIGNWMMTVYLNQGAFNLSSFLMSLLVTCLIGVIPVVIFGLQNQIKQERHNAAIAIDMVAQLQKKDVVKSTADDMVIAIQAMENYVNVYTLVNGQLQKEAVRRTLKSTQEDEQYQSLIKCHRSYLVNPDAIKEVSGNAQGLKLNMGFEDSPIVPVSRSYIPIIRGLMP